MSELVNKKQEIYKIVPKSINGESLISWMG